VVSADLRAVDRLGSLSAEVLHQSVGCVRLSCTYVPESVGTKKAALPLEAGTLPQFHQDDCAHADQAARIVIVDV
jgi:hypothetical protein